MNLDYIKENFRENILLLAKSHKAKNVRIFGSYANGKNTKNSDIDFLVSFDKTASLLDHAKLKDDLEELLGIDVDVVTDTAIKDSLKKQIISEAIYL